MAYEPPPRSWLTKFGESFRGVAVGVRQESSFWVHVVFTLAVIAVAAYFRVSRIETCLLVLCVSIVVAAEYMNTGLERLAKAMGHDYDPLIRDALDLASAAVLIAAIGAAIVGVIIFWPYILLF